MPHIHIHLPHIDDTSEGARKAWETRRRGGGGAKSTYRERVKGLKESPGGGRETASLKTRRVMREIMKVAESLGPHEALEDFGDRYGKNHMRAVARTMESLGPTAGFRHMREIIHAQHGGE